MFQLVKILLNLMRKRDRKSIIRFFIKGEKSLKYNKENGEEIWILIKDKDEF